MAHTQVTFRGYRLPIAYGLVFIGSTMLFNCSSKQKPLPIFGQREVVGNDTLYHTIANFSFVDQDSVVVTNQTFNDKIYVADFFFTSCRTI
ncbi:MAG: SCO family protein, partial [Flammeovirgaceae bacterium]